MHICAQHHYTSTIKFVYGNARQGARAKDLESAIDWLADAGMVHRVNRVGTPRLPLIAYEDKRAFKLFHLDVGLLGAMSNLDEQDGLICLPLYAMGTAREALMECAASILRRQRIYIAASWW